MNFLALNQGESGPNTAEFSVLDENGNTISSAQWNLATGAKAHFVIVKNE
ncbi:Secreted protein (fragment) [Capnocytophaga canimorsus]|uniref:Secreted protein n=1 Tax=Capnocytophaga canimorsus TaxID=28188 RepID=A0A0B7HFQ4_9FLAO